MADSRSEAKKVEAGHAISYAVRNKEVLKKKDDGDMSKAHRSLLEGATSGQIGDNLNNKINNANNSL